MSSYGAFDVGRLIGDQQRLQHELALSEQRYRRALEQGEMLLVANQSLRKEKERLEGQRRVEVEQLMASHREMYEKELDGLREEREHLLKRLEVLGEQQQLNNSLQATVQSLKGQLEHTQSELKNKEEEVERMHGVLLNPFSIQTVQQLQQQLQSQIEAEVREKKIIEHELTIKSGQLHQLSTEIEELKRQLGQQKARVNQLTREKYELEGRMPMDLVRQISSLREQRDGLLVRIERRPFESITEEEELYGAVQQLHGQIALLRLQLADSHHRREQSVAQLHQARAELKLQRTKADKEREVNAEEVKEVTLRLERTKADLRDKSDSQADHRSLQQEVALLKIKLFTMEALKAGESYRRQRNLELKEFEEQLRRLIGMDPPVNSAEVLKSVVELRVTVGDLAGRIGQEEAAKIEAQRKSKHYKDKYRTVAKENRRREEEAHKVSLAYKQRVQEYNSLVQRLQSELERALQLNAEVSQRRNLHLLVAPYQQKVELINTEVIMLQGQLRQYQATARADAQLHQQEVSHLKQEVERLKQQNSGLSVKSRRLEGQLLEQTLLTGEGTRNYEAQIAQKQRALVALEQELRSAKDMNAQHLKSLKASQERSLRQFKKELAKSQMLSAEQSQKEQANAAQVEAMKLKLEGFQQLFEDYRQADANSKAIALSEQVGSLRAQNQRLRSDFQVRDKKQAEAEFQNEGYRVRLIELQECLKKTVDEYEERLRGEQLRNSKLRMRTERLEEEMDMIRDRSGSEREIGLMQTSRKWEEKLSSSEEELSRLQEDLRSKEMQLSALQMRYEQLWQDNLKLIATLREHNIEEHTAKIRTEDYEQEQAGKVGLLERRIERMDKENESLKEHIQIIRRQLLQRSDRVPETDIQQMALLLTQKQQEAAYYREEMEKISVEATRDRQAFERDYGALVRELENMHRQLNEQQKELNNRKNLQHSELKQLKEELAANRDKVNYLKNELRAREEEITRLQTQGYREQLRQSGTYALQELSELREEIQQLRNLKFQHLDQIRALQHENNRLKIRNITEDMAGNPSSQGVFVNQTFGPHGGMAKSLVLRKNHSQNPGQSGHSDQHVKTLNSRIAALQGAQKRQQEALTVLTVVMAENDSLRARVEEAEAKAQQNYQQFIAYLNEEGRELEDARVNTELIKELEQAHRRLLEYTETQLSQLDSQDILAVSSSELGNEGASRRDLELQWTSSHQLISGKEVPNPT